jgi:8-oxo-dGTP pyrophosphatase MutT (NUDIX family)
VGRDGEVRPFGRKIDGCGDAIDLVQLGLYPRGESLPGDSALREAVEEAGYEFAG